MASCSQHVHPFPSTVWANQHLDQSAHYACRQEQQLPKHFASPGSRASAQYVQPGPAMAGFLNRLLLTASLFLHVIWALECNGRIQPNYIRIPQVISVRTPTNIKGARFNPQHAYFSYRNTLVYMNINLQRSYSLASIFYAWSQDRIFTLSYLRMISSLYSSFGRIDLVPFCCMQKA